MGTPACDFVFLNPDAPHGTHTTRAGIPQNRTLVFSILSDISIETKTRALVQKGEHAMGRGSVYE